MSSWVVCPVYNPEPEWSALVGPLRSLFDGVVVVDDASSTPVDHPGSPGVTLLRHGCNLGKGAALRTGIRHALASGATRIGTIDGDGEHDPWCFSEALALPRSRGLVILSRAPHFHAYSRARRHRNRILSGLISSSLKQAICDTQSGMRLLCADAARAVLGSARHPGYAFETEMLFSLAAAGFPITEIPMGRMGPEDSRKKADNIRVLAGDAVFFAAIALRSVSHRLRCSRWVGVHRRLPERTSTTSEPAE